MQSKQDSTSGAIPQNHTETALQSLQNSIIENVSHELRTPLTVILGFSELLKDGNLGVLTKEQEGAVYTIVSHAWQLRTLVERIGVLMEVEANSGVMEPLSLDEIVSGSVSARRQAEKDENRLIVDMQIEASLPRLIGNFNQVRQAVDCLVENAFKFTPSGGRVGVQVYSEAGWVCLSVVDTGIGLSDEDRERIFMQFYQVDRSATRQYGGIGLGLSIVKAVVERHGGQIKVASQLGLGSQFIVKFPVLAEGVGRRLGQKDYGQGAEAIVVKRILVVDDEQSVALMLRDGLETLPNCMVDVATNGEQALMLFAKQPYDLLITDYRMPGTDGAMLSERVREAYPDTAIIMITAYSSDELRDRAAQAAVHRILDKPVKLATIRGAALEVLAQPANNKP